MLGRYYRRAFIFMLIAAPALLVSAPVHSEQNKKPQIPLGSFTIEMNGSFKQKTPTGTDHQEENGKIAVRIERLPSFGGSFESHELVGSGELGWFETVTAPKCSYTASAKVDIRVSGTVHPFPVCNMDIKFQWDEATIYPMGTCQGFTLDPFRYSAHQTELPGVDLPVRNGQKIVFFLKDHGYMTTIVFRDVKLDYAGLGCLGN